MEVSTGLAFNNRDGGQRAGRAGAGSGAPSTAAQGLLCQPQPSKRLQLHRRGGGGQRPRSLESLQPWPGQGAACFVSPPLKTSGKSLRWWLVRGCEELQPEQGGGEGLRRGSCCPARVVPSAPAGPEWRGKRGPGWAARAWKWLPSTCTGTGEGETKVPNELVKHLYNFSSFYKEGLLYTIYTWR